MEDATPQKRPTTAPKVSKAKARDDDEVFGDLSDSEIFGGVSAPKQNSNARGVSPEPDRAFGQNAPVKADRPSSALARTDPAPVIEVSTSALPLPSLATNANDPFAARPARRTLGGNRQTPTPKQPAGNNTSEPENFVFAKPPKAAVSLF